MREHREAAKAGKTATSFPPPRITETEVFCKMQQQQTRAWPKIANISATARRCEDEGLGISANALRRWVKDGAFPTVPVGNSRFINWDVLIAFLEAGSLPDPRGSLPYRTRARRR